MLVVLFFNCMTALFTPANRKRDGIKWGLVSYTVAMFSFVTVHMGIGLHALFTSFIDNHEFTDSNGTLVGPYGYRLSNHLTVPGTILDLMYILNNLLADGLLVRSFLDVAFTFPGG